MNVEDLRFCVDCAHHRRRWVGSENVDVCGCPELDTVYDLVTGAKVPRRCEHMRGAKIKCGRGGDYWAPLPAPWWRGAVAYVRNIFHGSSEA